MSFGLLISWLVFSVHRLPAFVPGSPQLYQSCLLGSVGLGPVLSCLHLPLALAASPCSPVRPVLFLAECPAPPDKSHKVSKEEDGPSCCIWCLNASPASPCGCPQVSCAWLSQKECCYLGDEWLCGVFAGVWVLGGSDECVCGNQVVGGIWSFISDRAFGSSTSSPLLKRKQARERGGWPCRPNTMVERGFA